MANQKHIVLITTWYPPRHGVAVSRMKAFAHYLAGDQFKMSVITLGKGHEIASGVQVYRLENTNRLKRLGNIPGENKLVHNLKVLWNVLVNYLNPLEYQAWRKAVLKQLDALHQKQPIDVLISSYSPLESHLAAADFAAKNPNICWVADMRDEMSANGQIGNRRRNILKNAEKRINTRANLITAVSKPILDDFKKLTPDIPHFLEIRNGFDHDLKPQHNFNEKFTITYAGTFYGPRKPYTFFKGLQEFLKKYEVDFEIRFIGTHHNFDIPLSIEKHCRFFPQMPNSEAIQLIAASDANLLILPPVESKGIYSGKIFDYLSVRKPVIAVVDTSDVAAQLITEFQAGFIAEFNDIRQISLAIESAYLLWKNRSILPESPQKIETLHRKYQVETLSKFLLTWTDH